MTTNVGGTMRLLICDDSAEARTAVRTMLAEEGRIEIVAEAANGAQAVALAVEATPDVILMDVAMPVLDGVEATRQIRMLLPGTRIVAFAGSDDNEVVAQMIEAGADAYCVKGAPLWELERAIQGQSDPLVRLAHGLARTVNGTASAEILSRQLLEQTGAAVVATYLTSSDVGLSLAGLAGALPEPPLRSAPGVVARAFEEATLVRADRAELAELWRLGCPAPVVVAAPLVADGEAFGALLVASSPRGSSPDEELISAAADLAAVSLANLRRLALTYAEARRDALTGLANRRAFDEHIQRLAGEARGEIAVAILDIDNFKEINDRHGHLAGDEVLTELSRVLQRALRADEQVFRVGGEEFAIVISGSAQDAGRVAERARGAVLAHRRGRRLPTFSAGAAGLRPGVEPVESALRRADEALYSAKRAGKNRVVVAGPSGNERLTLARGPAEVRATPVRVLVVDDDPGLRQLLRATFEVVDMQVQDAPDATTAQRVIAQDPPDVAILDVGMPGLDGLELCRRLKRAPHSQEVAVILLTGAEDISVDAAREAGADTLLRKPFSPLELLGIVEQLAGGPREGRFQPNAAGSSEEQLLLYAQDLRRLREIERGQRVLLQRAYRETVTALASALESKDTGTHDHSQRVVRYALELAASTEPALLDDQSVEYGFLLHDVGKIGIPDRILQKTAPLTPEERRLMETHTILGEQMLGEVALLQGEGLKVVRCHHERWDGNGYPDGLGGTSIPLGARVFAVADALDAITSHRPYHEPRSWQEAVEEIVREAGRQFDPVVVEVFGAHEPRLRRIHYELMGPEPAREAGLYLNEQRGR